MPWAKLLWLVAPQNFWIFAFALQLCALCSGFWILAVAFALIMSLITFNYNFAARLRKRIAAHLPAEPPFPLSRDGDGHQKWAENFGSVSLKGLWKPRPSVAMAVHFYYTWALWVLSSANLIGRLTPTHRWGSAH